MRLAAELYARPMSTDACVGIFAAAVREHDAVGDDDRVGVDHVARQPRRHQLHSGGALLDLEGRHRAVRHLAVLDGRGELRVLGPPERHQHPPRAVGVFPGGQRPPGACARKVHFLVADQRRLMDRRAMVLAAERAGVEQPDAAFLARLRGVLAALVLEDRAGDVHVEVALAQPEGVGRREPVLHLHRLGRRVLFGRDDRLAEDLLLGEVVAVAAAGIDAAVLANRRAQPRPQPAAAGIEAADLLRRQVVRVELVRVAAAALRGRRVEHVVVVVQAVRLAVGRQERLGRGGLLAGRRVERPQPPVPRDRVDRVLAGRRAGHDDRRRRQPARAQHVRPRRPVILEGAVEWRFQICVPGSTSMP